MMQRDKGFVPWPFDFSPLPVQLAAMFGYVIGLTAAHPRTVHRALLLVSLELKFGSMLYAPPFAHGNQRRHFPFGAMFQIS